jgi:hypothetical protein
LGEVWLQKFSLFLLRNFLTSLHAQLTLTSLPGMFWERFGCKIQSISPERSPNSNISMAHPISFSVRFLFDPPGVILPLFWKQWPRVYFAGAELAFAKNNVTDSQDKFNYLLNSFPWESLLDIQHELLLAGHSISPYEALKESLISIYGNNEPCGPLHHPPQRTNSRR